MIPTSLPELPKASRTQGKRQQVMFYDPKVYNVKSKEKPLSALLLPLTGPMKGSNRLPDFKRYLRT